jgi:hypothetical protein
MGKDFEKRVCAVLWPILRQRGYATKSPCTFVRLCGPSSATVWLVPGTGSLTGNFMPRLSVGLASVGSDVAVLSTDLHVLKSPETAAWYPWEIGKWDPSEVSKDLITLGLPWLERNTDLEQMAEVLEGRRRRSKEPRRTSWWPFGPSHTAPRSVDSAALQFLSHCREAQGRYGEALKVWEEYAASLTALREGTEAYDKISARTEDLRSKIATAHGTLSD